MDQQKRLLLAISLSFGLTLVWTTYFWKPQADAELAALAARQDAGMVVLDGGEAFAAQTPPVEPQLEAVAAEVPARDITFDSPSTSLTFSSEGGGLVSAKLLGERLREEKHLTVPEGWRKLFGEKFSPAPQMNMARPIAGVGPNIALSLSGEAPISPTQRYAVSEESPGRVSFVARTGAWEVTKTFTWNHTAQSDQDPAAFLTNLAVTVKNVSAVVRSTELGLHALRGIVPGAEEAPSMFGGIGNQASVLCRVADDVARKIPPAEGGGLFSCGGTPVYEEEKKGPLHFVGIDQQYFLTAIWPKEAAAEGRCLMTAKPAERGAALFLPLSLQPNESTTRNFGVFLGPKDLGLLAAVGTEGPGLLNPGLDRTVDFGIWAVICKVLIVLMRFFFSVVGNWGVAIILLTLTVKILVLPLTHRAMVSAEKMKAMQPKMEEIRKKFPDDQMKQMEEMRKIGIDPMANLTGCLPIFLQLPVWAALFTTLRTSYELYGEPFFGVWSNLTSKDPTYLLPLALGVTMVVTQKLQPQMMEKSQAAIMTWVMPVFFTAIMMNYPAGLALYIFTNNLLSIVQQFALRKYLARTGQITTTPPLAGAGK
jgi:YidC/Oxa1 family membrane protein insertase